jgi:hypothetical protein
MYYRIFFVFLVGGAIGALGLGLRTFLKISYIQNENVFFILQLFQLSPNEKSRLNTRLLAAFHAV